MKRWRSNFVLLGGVAGLALAIPALSQDRPESLLPPGFGQPQTQPPPQEQPPAPPADPTPAPSPTPAPTPSRAPPPQTTFGPAEEELTELIEVPVPEPIELPEDARRSTEIVGPLTAANWGLGSDAFGSANGRFLSVLMRRLNAPLPSRWTSMLLRRALLSRVPAPAFVQPVDWVAERAWLLLRMGEADAARMLVQAVDVDQFTPKMFGIAVQTALATADPAGLCPLVEPGRETSDEPVWQLSDAMCAALSGEPGRASSLIEQARRRSGAGGIDLLLAEKMVGAGANSRRSATIQWDEVDSLNAWRFGLASAAGAEIPDRLLASSGPHLRAWHARAPMVPIEQRVDSAQVAASLGVFSNASLVEMQSLIGDATDPSELADTVAGKLRTAHVGRNLGDRMTALRSLWDVEGEVDRHARKILTARAAAGIRPNPELAADAPDLIASMLTAGMDRHAARWAPMVQNMEGEAGDRAWAMLAVGAPEGAVEISPGRVGNFFEADNSPQRHRARLLLAALAGLGRIDAGAASSLAEDYGINLGRENRWTRMLDAAARNGQPGTVALLAGIGMQTPDWRGVPAFHFYRIIRALRQVGLEYEARMIAAEALSRL